MKCSKPSVSVRMTLHLYSVYLTGALARRGYKEYAEVHVQVFTPIRSNLLRIYSDGLKNFTDSGGRKLRLSSKIPEFGNF
jgi:hypothetical protein